jgi:hypothetical protein
MRAHDNNKKDSRTYVKINVIIFIAMITEGAPAAAAASAYNLK